MTLQEHIDDIRNQLKQGAFPNEAAVSFGIVLKLLDTLGWPRFKPHVVIHEYGMEGQRIDFALCHPEARPLVFIRVKQVGNIDKETEQLLEYAFYIGVPIVILTDGQKWRFFYPTGEGRYNERKVYELDLIESDSEESVERLNRYLNYEVVRKGDAVTAIKNDYEEVSMQREIEERLIMKEPKEVHWYIKEQYLEIEFYGLGLVIEGVNSHFAAELASNLSLGSIESSHRFSGPPQVILQKRNVIITFWKYPQHPHNRRPDPSTLTTMAEVVEDIIATMGKDDRVNVRSKTKDQLIDFNFGWGQGIRNYYRLWHNKSLVRAIGEEHPKDASLVIIEAVWKQLQQTDDEDTQVNDYNTSLQWHVDKQCLEISWGRGKSIVIEGINLDFAETFANELGLHLFQMATRYQPPDVKPQTMQIAHGVMIKLVKEMK